MLEIQDLHVKFHNRDREAVSGVNLTIQDGEILGLVGESGSGKSVTAMSVAGLLPRKRCDYTGRILLDGQGRRSTPRCPAACGSRCCSWRCREGWCRRPAVRSV